VQHKLQGADERSFQGGDVHLAVALAGVTVAHFKKRAGGEDGNEERGARRLGVGREWPRQQGQKTGLAQTCNFIMLTGRYGRPAFAESKKPAAGRVSMFSYMAEQLNSQTL